MASTSEIGEYIWFKIVPSVGCFKGLLIKYTNGAWMPVPDAVVPPITTVQYRANEAEE